MASVVLDTNVLVSALISDRGAPRQIYDAWEAGRFDLITAPPLVEELVGVLSRGKIRRRYRLSDDDITSVTALILRHGIVLREPMDVEPVTGDLLDDLVLACCLHAPADYLVTGDIRLLNLQTYAGSAILSPRRFVSEILTP